MRTCYTVALPAMMNICKGVYTNKKILYATIADYASTYKATVFFQGALGYETKKFNYNNVQRLLKAILVGESFAVKLKFIDEESGLQKTVILEITRHKFNQTSFI